MGLARIFCCFSLLIASATNAAAQVPPPPYVTIHASGLVSLSDPASGDSVNDQDGGGAIYTFDEYCCDSSLGALASVDLNGPLGSYGYSTMEVNALWHDPQSAEFSLIRSWGVHAPAGAEYTLSNGMDHNFLFYVFIATQTGKVTLGYDLSASGDYQTLDLIHVAFNHQGGQSEYWTLGSDLGSGPEVGVLSFEVVEGELYSLGMSAQSAMQSANWILAETALGDTDISATFVADFALTLAGEVGAGVPEPASWAMLIAGFGLVGAAARRRRVALR